MYRQRDIMVSWKCSLILTSATPPACDRLQNQWQPGFYHLGRLIGRTAPSTRRPECLCRWQTAARTARWGTGTPVGGEDGKRHGSREPCALTVMTLNTDWAQNVIYCVFDDCRMCLSYSAIFILENNLCEIRRRILSSAQVWKRPHCISHHC